MHFAVSPSFNIQNKSGRKVSGKPAARFARIIKTSMSLSHARARAPVCVFVSRLEFAFGTCVSRCPNCGIIQPNYPCKHLTRSPSVRLFSYISVPARHSAIVVAHARMFLVKIHAFDYTGH